MNMSGGSASWAIKQAESQFGGILLSMKLNENIVCIGGEARTST